jgi:hypothetical protein
MSISAISVVEDAFNESGISDAELDPTPVVLGSDSWDRYVFHILKLGGVDVKLVRRAEGEEEPLYQAAQITTDEAMEDAFKVTELQKISMVDGNEFLGLQVKLSGACEWHVTVSDEIPERKSVAHTARTSTRSTGGRTSTTIQNRVAYEIALDCSEDVPDAGLRTTVVFAHAITINILFEYGDFQVVYHQDKFPVVGQRRIDIAFTSKNVLTMQVCSCSVLF